MTTLARLSAFGRLFRAGILAAFAITLTGGSAWADDPAASDPAPVLAPTPTPAPAPAQVTAPTAAPSSSALPWLAQPSPVATFNAADSRPHSSRMLWLVLPALALGGGALYMRFAKRRGPLAVSRRLEVLDTARVGPKAHVVMVSVGGRQLLLGVTEQSVQRLGWMPGESKVDATIDVKVKDAPEARASSSAHAPDGPFAHILRAFTQRKDATDSDSDVALKIAAETKDTFERRSAPVDMRGRAIPPSPEIKIVASGDPSDVEEQVSGLRKRRTGKHG